MHPDVGRKDHGKGRGAVPAAGPRAADRARCRAVRALPRPVGWAVGDGPGGGLVNPPRNERAGPGAAGPAAPSVRLSAQPRVLSDSLLGQVLPVSVFWV